MRLPGLVVVLLLAAGCATTTPGTPTAPSAGPAGPSSVAPADGPGTCTVVAGGGSVSMRGGSGRVATVNGVTTLTCGSGPAVTLARIGTDGVDLQVAGAPRATLRAGETTALGPYTVTVDAVTGGKATLRISPPR